MLNEKMFNALYGGGWRTSDKDELITEYGFTSDEIEEVIQGLQQVENSQETNIKKWYAEKFPNDEEGEYLKDDTTFYDLFYAMDNYKCPYQFAGISDSVVRERIFEKLAEIIQVDYDYIYDQWLKCHEYDE